MSTEIASNGAWDLTRYAALTPDGRATTRFQLTATGRHNFNYLHDLSVSDVANLRELLNSPAVHVVIDHA